MYLNFLCMKGKNNVFELERMYTAKSITISHVMIKSVAAAMDQTPIFLDLNFVADNNYKNFSNRVGYYENPDNAEHQKPFSRKMCIGHGENGKVLWKDLYINLIDPSKHEAIHIPKQIEINFYKLDTYGGLVDVADSDLESGGFISVTLDFEYVN